MWRLPSVQHTVCLAVLVVSLLLVCCSLLPPCLRQVAGSCRGHTARARDDKLRFPLTGSLTSSLTRSRRGLGSGRYLAAERSADIQRRVSGKSGKEGSGVSYLVVSLLSVCLLLCGDRPEQTARPGFKKLLRRFLLHRPPGLQGNVSGAQSPPWTESRSEILGPDGPCPCPGRRTTTKEGWCTGCLSPALSAKSGGLSPDDDRYRWWWWWRLHPGPYRHLTPFSPLSWRVAPATTDYLPTSCTARGDDSAVPMDHLGYRVATLAGLPANCPLSRVRLAEAGFHWDPSVSRQAVVCHGCPVVYSLQQAPGAPGPLRVHVDGSPQCPVVTAVCGRLCWAGSASSASSPSSSVGSGSSTSVSASLTTGGGGGRGGEDAREPGPDGEGQSGERSDASTTTITNTTITNTTITNTTVAQRPDSQPSLTGYVLALAGSDMDQRLEPSLPPSPSPFPGPSPSPPAAAAAASPSHSDSLTDRRGGPLSLGGAVYPHYSTSQARHLTFRAFPTAMAAAFPAEVMVSLGFFYAGYADCVRCFYCGVGLKSWAPSDDPLAEHVRWRPDCRFLLATKGRQCIQRLLRQINGPSEAPAVSGVRGVHERSSGGSGGSEPPAQGPQRVSLGQQLVTMGFAVKDIQSARARLRTAGSPEDLDHYLQILLT